MKTIFFGLLLFVSSAFATSIDRTPVVAELKGYEQGITAVALLADGRLQIVDKDAKVTTRVLSPLITQRLLSRAMILSNVKAQTHHTDITCKALMMIRPMLTDLTVANYDYDTRTFGKESLILTAEGCAYSDVTVPVETYAYNSAIILREQMALLALETIKK